MILFWATEKGLRTGVTSRRVSRWGLFRKIAVATLLPERFGMPLPNSGSLWGIGMNQWSDSQPRFPKRDPLGSAWNGHDFHKAALAALRTLDSDPPKFPASVAGRNCDGPIYPGDGRRSRTGIAVGQCRNQHGYRLFGGRANASRAKMIPDAFGVTTPTHSQSRHSACAMVPYFLKASPQRGAHPDPDVE